MGARRQDDMRMREALRAAQLYYLQDLTMDAIGDELNVSRSSVSRLLDLARNMGIVDIHINSPADGPRRIEEEISDRFSVSAHLVPVPEGTAPVDRLERVAVSAARMLSQFFSSSMTMGIAWGSTISAVSRHLPRKITSNSQIVQLNGAGNDQTSGVDYSGEILRRFGEAFSAQIQHFPAPAFFDDPRAKSFLWEERSTQRILELQKRSDVALFGLGTTDAEVPSQVYAGGYLSAPEIATLRDEGIVGDVATVLVIGKFFNDRTGGCEFTVGCRVAPNDVAFWKNRPKPQPFAKICKAFHAAKYPYKQSEHQKRQCERE